MGRKRVALVTTQLGPGGAEQVLYDIAATLCPSHYETLLLATQSRDSRWLARWRQRVDHVYDLAQVVTTERMTAAVYSIITNWRCDYVVLQNSLYGYAALSHIKRLLPFVQVIDVNHYVDECWDQIASTAEATAYIDRRIALADSVRDHLLALGTPESKILLMRNGVDLERFRPAPRDRNSTKTILFAARLNPRKRPLLLADIARELTRLRPQRDFRFVVAGDGSEKERFQNRVHRLGLDSVFDFRGQVDDLPPLLEACDIMIIPSSSEGVPLVMLEALASGRPVVASRVGAIPEVLDASCGALIDQPDAVAFARAIHSLLDQPELREKMGAAGRRKMEMRHDILKTREAFASLFDQNLVDQNLVDQNSFDPNSVDPNSVDRNSVDRKPAADQRSSVSVASTSRSTAME